MTLRHIRRPARLGLVARLLGRNPALTTRCGAPITADDFAALPNNPEAHPRLCLSCYMAAHPERKAEIQRAVDSPN